MKLRESKRNKKKCKKQLLESSLKLEDNMEREPLIEVIQLMAKDKKERKNLNMQ